MMVEDIIELCTKTHINNPSTFTEINRLRPLISYPDLVKYYKQALIQLMLCLEVANIYVKEHYQY